MKLIIKAKSLLWIINHTISQCSCQPKNSDFQGMSLDVLSEQTGVSKSMLAQIEKGTANP